ncbi:lysophospholipid acyltransferase family protein [Nocardia asteroides]|uniref:lysophospholipid acyltransferase family protein n=1 Tax=Nocardia asteroides TaxID=1824 RepID=UPI001E4CA3EE|nr:lysophospholipid acyltransferase family protein [Nocardia asteroides]UGT63836.1 1-acyl-sn-glycerol-3-phosphate acyltransferase [Nocardia asteroides]
MVTEIFAAPRAAAAHSWMPDCPCGSGCIDEGDRVGRVRMAARIAGVAGLLLSFPVVNGLAPAGRREQVQRGYARAMLRVLGIRLSVIDNRDNPRSAGAAVDIGSIAPKPNASRPGSGSTSGRAAKRTRFAEPAQGALIIAGHISWSDVLVLAAVQPLGFVARADMLEWPVLGKLAVRMRVIPIERESLRKLPDVVSRLRDRLQAGDRVAAFPEGTTWCGRAYGSLRPALFQAAIDAGTPVHPVRLAYRDGNGNPCTVPAFIGDDGFTTSAARVLRARGMVAEVVLEPRELPGSDRRDLARRVERAVRGESSSRHGSWIEAGFTRVQDPESEVNADRPRHAKRRFPIISTLRPQNSE